MNAEERRDGIIMIQKPTTAEMLIYVLEQAQESIDNEFYALAASYMEHASMIMNDLQGTVALMEEDCIHVNMNDVYEEVNNAEVTLEVDGADLVIRIPYIQGDAEDIKSTLEKDVK